MRLGCFFSRYPTYPFTTFELYNPFLDYIKFADLLILKL